MLDWGRQRKHFIAGGFVQDDWKANPEADG